MMKKLLLLMSVVFSVMQAKTQSNYNLIIGTYTAPGKSEGIYLYNFDTKTGGSVFKNVTKGIVNPSYLAISKNHSFVYSVGEQGRNSGVTAFNFDAAAGSLTFLNNRPAEGADPCYIIADEKNVITANYSSGSISVFGIEENGRLSPIKQVVKHSGRSITDRQKSPHVHMVKFTPDKKYLLVNDLGTDKVYLYTYSANSNDKILTAKDSISVKAGSGPRHLVFSNDGKFAYLIHEINGAVTVFSYKDGALKIIGENSIVGKNFKGENGAADIHISPDGKFLYASNRGSENNITVFAIQKDGGIVFKNQYSTLGKGPRNFVIDPTGNYLLVGHQYTDNVVVFKRNKSTGALTDTGKRIQVGAPVCLVFAPVH